MCAVSGYIAGDTASSSNARRWNAVGVVSRAKSRYSPDCPGRSVFGRTRLPTDGAIDRYFDPFDREYPIRLPGAAPPMVSRSPSRGQWANCERWRRRSRPCWTAVPNCSYASPWLRPASGRCYAWSRRPSSTASRSPPTTPRNGCLTCSSVTTPTRTMCVHCSAPSPSFQARSAPPLKASLSLLIHQTSRSSGEHYAVSTLTSTRSQAPTPAPNCPLPTRLSCTIPRPLHEHLCPSI